MAWNSLLSGWNAAVGMDAIHCTLKSNEPALWISAFVVLCTRGEDVCEARPHDGAASARRSAASGHREAMAGASTTIRRPARLAPATPAAARSDPPPAGAARPHTARRARDRTLACRPGDLGRFASTAAHVDAVIPIAGRRVAHYAGSRLSLPSGPWSPATAVAELGW